MTFKETAKWAGMGFLIAMAGIVICAYLHMIVFDVDFSLGKKQFGEFILFALFCGLSMFIFYSRRDLGDREMRIRQVIHCIALTGVTVLSSLQLRWILPKASHILFILLSVSVGYCIVWFAIALENKHTAGRLNKALVLRKKRRKTDDDET